MTHTPESLRRLMHDLFEAWNAHDVKRVTEFYAPDYEEVDVAQVGPQRGREGVRLFMVLYLRAFPDLELTLDEVIVQGDRVALAWTWQGTHRGTFMHIPPTHRKVTVRGTSFVTVEDGKVKRGLRVWDMAGLLRSLGLLPDL